MVAQGTWGVSQYREGAFMVVIRRPAEGYLALIPANPIKVTVI